MNENFETQPKTKPDGAQREGPIARTIEQQTAKLPPDVFLWAALGSIGASLMMMVAGNDKKANFIGTWTPS